MFYSECLPPVIKTGSVEAVPQFRCNQLYYTANPTVPCDFASPNLNPSKTSDLDTVPLRAKQLQRTA